MSNVPHGARRRDVFLLYFPFIFPLFSPYIRGNFSQNALYVKRRETCKIGPSNTVYSKWTVAHKGILWQVPTQFGNMGVLAIFNLGVISPWNVNTFNMKLK